MTPQIADSDLIRELRELRERLDEFPVPTQSFEGSLPAVKIKKDPAKTNYKLKPRKLPVYSGDRVTYAAWRRAVLSTLQIDWNNFQYDNPSVFLMIFNALEGKVKKEAPSFFGTGGRKGQQDPEDFISFLDRSN